MRGLIEAFFARRVTTVIVPVIVALLSGRPSSAAEITCSEKYGWNISAEISPDKRALALERWPSGRLPGAETCRRALIRGTIVAGDSVKFLELLQNSHPFLERVSLWSSGGSVEEAMKIGRLIRKGLVETEAPLHLEVWPTGHGRLGYPPRMLCSNAMNCHCASACFIIWAAGVERWGNLLGLHRPTTQSTGFANLPPDRAAVLYRQLLSEIAKYLTEMEVAPRFVEIMTDTSSRDIRWLTSDEANALAKPPSIAEWTAVTCGAMSKSEQDRMALIAVNANATPQEKQLREQLEKRSFEIYSCGVDKIAKARDAIKDLRN